MGPESVRSDPKGTAEGRRETDKPLPGSREAQDRESNAREVGTKLAPIKAKQIPNPLCTKGLGWSGWRDLKPSLSDCLVWLEPASAYSEGVSSGPGWLVAVSLSRLAPMLAPPSPRSAASLPPMASAASRSGLGMNGE